MDSAGCPGGSELEEYFYGDIFPVRAGLIKYHLGKCAACRQQLEEIRRFDELLRNIPLEEPPPELCGRIIASIRETEPADHPGRSPVLRPLFQEGMLVRVRWAATAALLLLNLLFYHGSGAGLSLFGSKTYTLGWADLRFIYGNLKPGALWASLKQVLVALRADGLFTLEIMGSVLPLWFSNVLIVTGLTLVVWIAYSVVSRRSEGKNHEETVQVEVKQGNRRGSRGVG